MILVSLLGAAGGYLYWNLSDLPEIRSLERYQPMESSVVYSADGKVLAEFYLERRNFIAGYRIPALIKRAFVAIEDQRYYSHPGVDLIGMLRALYKDIIAKSIVEGGSTITQQLSKMLFLKPEKSVGRKLKEMIIALQIEKRYTKDEILGMYLNQAYFGTRAYGIEAAAQTYFGKSVFDLDAAEAAMLAGLQKAPTMYSPFKNPQKALSRRRLVLKKMFEAGYITADEFKSSDVEPLPLTPFYRKYTAPYFIEFLRQRLEEKYGEGLYKSGLRIYSTIDSAMQEAAEGAVQKGISEIEKRVKPGIQAAIIVIDPKTGHIRAMVGGNDFWETQFNRATMALRQPGSAFKPFVYAAALEQGMTADDEILDEPVMFQDNKPGSFWSPKNYDNQYRGYVSLKTAIALSLNAATVRLAEKVGVKSIVELARRCGIKSELQPYLSIALGASDVIPIELTSAYGVFATGKRVDPVPYEKVADRNGITLDETFPLPREVLSPEMVDKTKYLLNAVVEMGTAYKARALKKKLYGKTGTTNDFSDAWFIGFDEKIVVGVWVGRDNHKPIGRKEAGAQAALPIWIDFMKSVYQQEQSDNLTDPISKQARNRVSTGPERH
jgi:penicillin-binding protein 1A